MQRMLKLFNHKTSAFLKEPFEQHTDQSIRKCYSETIENDSKPPRLLTAQLQIPSHRPGLNGPSDLNNGIKLKQRSAEREREKKEKKGWDKTIRSWVARSEWLYKSNKAIMKIRFCNSYCEVYANLALKNVARRRVNYPGLSLKQYRPLSHGITAPIRSQGPVHFTSSSHFSASFQTFIISKILTAT